MEKGKQSFNQYRVEVDTRLGFTCHVDLSGLDPYEYPIFSFYSRNELLGYLPYTHVKSQNGYVSLNALVPTVHLDHVELYTLAPIQGENEEDEKRIYAYFDNGALTDINMLYERAIHVISGDVEYLYERPLGVEVHACAQLAMMMRRFNIPLDMADRTASRFEDARLCFEKQAFLRMMNPFLGPGAERNLVKLLFAIGTPKESIINGTLADSLNTLRLGLFRPYIYIQVHWTEVPLELSRAHKLELRPGGYVHLHPSFAGEWLWQRLKMQWRAMNTYIWQAPLRELVEVPMWEAAKMTFHLFMYGLGVNNQPLHHPRFKPAELTGITRKRSNLDQDFVPKYSGVGADMIPACLRFDQWPKVHERTQLAYNMQKAMVDIEDLIDILHQFRNLTFPGATRESAIKGADPKSLYKNYSPQSCSTHIQNRTKSGRIVRCPYTADTEMGCKEQCIQELRSHYVKPSQYAVATSLYAPFRYIELRQKAEIYANRTNTKRSKEDMAEEERQKAEQEREDRKAQKEIEYWGFDLYFVNFCTQGSSCTHQTLCASSALLKMTSFTWSAPTGCVRAAMAP